jgi:hypothetical protein
MANQLMVTASAGLYHDANDMYYLQIIMAERESNYLLNISKQEAKEISKKDGIEIAETSDSLSLAENRIGNL